MFVVVVFGGCRIIECFWVRIWLLFVLSFGSWRYWGERVLDLCIFCWF